MNDTARKLWSQKQLSSRLSALNISVSPRYLGQRVDLMNPDIQFILDNEAKELSGVSLKFFSSGNIVE